MLPEYPELSNDVVRLRPWCLGDLHFVETAATEPELIESTTLPVPYSRDEGVAFIERQRDRLTSGVGLSLAIVESAIGAADGLLYMGVCPQPRTVTLGYVLLRGARGKGLATNGVRLLSRWALTSGFAERIEAVVEPWNQASQEVLRRNGFRREGLLRSYQVLRTRRADVIMFSLLPSDLDDLDDLDGSFEVAPA